MLCFDAVGIQRLNWKVLQVGSDDDLGTGGYGCCKYVTIFRSIRHSVDKNFVSGHCGFRERLSHCFEKPVCLECGQAFSSDEAATDFLKDLFAPVQTIKPGISGTKQCIPQRSRKENTGVEKDPNGRH
jgi:hypothetical protein